MTGGIFIPIFMKERAEEMRKYVGTKVIEAKPMTRGDYNEYKGWQIPANENPADEGYLVKYSDGYVSWSPAYVFEEVYREYDENKLPATAVGMMSADYKERFKAEYKQLMIRFEGLKGMLKKWDEGTLPFEPTCPRSTYNMQIKAMADYMAVLEARAVIENIDLMV